MKKLFYETLGHGPDIVMLHGWGLHSGIWQSTAMQLAKNFRVTLIDLPGFGRSEPISDYSIENVAELLAHVAPHQAIWVGWSLGGFIAAKYALLKPERVLKLICVASTPKFINTADWPGMETAVLHRFYEQLGTDYEGTLTRFLLLQFRGLPVNKQMLTLLNKSLFLYGKPSIQTLNASLHLLEKGDLRSHLPKLCCPTLYLFGKMDTLVPIGVAQCLAVLQSSAECIIFEKAGHAMFLSHETEFVREVRRFCHE